MSINETYGDEFVYSCEVRDSRDNEMAWLGWWSTSTGALEGGLELVKGLPEAAFVEVVRGDDRDTGDCGEKVCVAAVRDQMSIAEARNILGLLAASAPESK